MKQTTTTFNVGMPEARIYGPVSVMLFRAGRVFAAQAALRGGALYSCAPLAA
ncbi:MAG: hypothetical protein Q7T01_00775 [bacterium]|nr:hypothetical protein [bacterium]